MAIMSCKHSHSYPKLAQFLHMRNEIGKSQKIGCYQVSFEVHKHYHKFLFPQNFCHSKKSSV